MKSGFSSVASTLPWPTASPGNRDVFFITPPMVSETVTIRWGGMTIVPLKDTWLGLEVAEVTASTCTVSVGASSAVRTGSSTDEFSLFEVQAASNNSNRGNVIFFMVVFLFK